MWIPGHSGIKDNEITDQLAKAESKTRLLDLEPVLGIPFCLGG